MGWTISRAVPLVNDHGQIVEWFGAATDITERKEADEALRRSEARLARAVEVGGLGIFEHDHRAEVLEFSPMMGRLTGFGDGLSDGRHTDGPRVRLWVEDKGIGIAAGDREKVFGVFQRLHGKGAYSGKGLGLAIVRKGAERMGGSVGVESEQGAGSRFWVEFKAADVERSLDRRALRAVTSAGKLARSVSARAKLSALIDPEHGRDLGVPWLATGSRSSEGKSGGSGGART